MEFKEARELVKTITYKKGWKFEIQNHWMSAEPVLWMLAEVQDSTIGKNAILQIESEWEIPNFSVMNNRDLIAFVLKTALAQEIHEAREFLRVGGKAMYHPHTHYGNAEWDAYFYDGVRVKTSARPAYASD